MKRTKLSAVGVSRIGRWTGQPSRRWAALVSAGVLWFGAGLGLPEAGVLAAATAQTPGHLINISTRARIGVGDDVVVCGFVITG
jgi:hypothetical protein